MPPSPIPLSPAAVRLAVEHLPAPSAFCGASAAAYRELIAAWGLATQPNPVVADPPPVEVAPEPTVEPVTEPAPPLVLVNPPAKDKIRRARLSGTKRPRKLFGKVDRAWYPSNGYRVVAERYGVGVCAIVDAGGKLQRGVWLSDREYANVRDELRSAQDAAGAGDEPPAAVGIGGAK